MTRPKFSELASGQSSDVAVLFSSRGAVVAILVLSRRQRRGTGATGALAASGGPLAANDPRAIAHGSEPDGDGRRCSGALAKFEGGQDGSQPD